MRAERLLSIILLLQSHQRMTAADLAHRLDVSERTILRDMDALSLANIPVYSERGRNGGWALVEGYRNRLAGFSAEEISALILAPSRILSDLGLEDAAETATLKLVASLPALRQRDVNFVRQRIHIDGAAWLSKDENLNYLTQLQEAIWQEQEIIIHYQRGGDDSVERRIAPLGLVVKGCIWYLIALIEADYRTYRVSRIENVILTGDAIKRPDNFDLAAYWDASTQAFVANLPRYIVNLQVRKDALRFIKDWRFAHIQSIAEKDADWLDVIIDLEDMESAVACILACAGRAIIIEPDELADNVQSKLKMMCR